MSAISTLRAIANRLTLTPVENLPHQVGFLATSISACADILQNGGSHPDIGAVIHKLKTRVSALLQDRIPEGRFCGIVIARALVEAGGVSILLDSGNWVRAIISCLNKTDSAEAKKLGVLTIARIYLLTVDNQQLVREVTTPTLPAFISASLSIIRPATATINDRTVRSLSPLLESVLASWNSLLDHFSSTIRPNSSSIRSICLSLVSDEACSTAIHEAAYDVLAKVHHCAPKNTAPAEWSQSCSQLIEAAHDTADLVLRAIIEEWTPTITRISKVTKKQKSANAPSTSGADVAGLESWSGVSAGCSRIINHICLLQHFFSGPHSSDISVPLGALFDLTSRLSAVTIPTTKYSPRTNNDVTRDEREELWLNLPRLHASVLELYHELIGLFGQALYQLSSVISSQIWDIFEAEHGHERIRIASYKLINSMLTARLIKFSKVDSVNIKLLTKHCCHDLQPSDSVSTRHKLLANGTSGTKQASNGAGQLTDLGQSKKKPDSLYQIQTQVYSSAYTLLPALLTYIDFQKLDNASTIRAQLDSTAILLNHHEALLASVLYPPNSSTAVERQAKKAATPSLLPFLARSMDGNGNTKADITQQLAFEALLRPRMPGIPVVSQVTAITSSEKDPLSSDEEQDAIMLDQGPLDDQENQSEIPTPHIDEGNQTSGSRLQPPQKANTQPHSTKRDFTTLLDQSADEQLAASAAEDPRTLSQPLSVQETIIPTSDNKRTKTTHDNGVSNTSLQTTTSLLDTTTPIISDATTKARQPQVESPSTSIATAGTSKVSHAPVKLASTSTETTKQQVSLSRSAPAGDDDSSSDSDVPLIDATLVGFSDSEDDEEEE